MTAYTIDTSVVVKWFLPEPDAEAAARLRRPGLEIHAPDFLLLEACNVFWKYLRKGILASGTAERAIEALAVAPIRWHDTASLFAGAFRLGVQTGRTVYDCTYLTLSLRVHHPLVTADRKFYDAIKAGPFGSHLIWVADVP